MLTIPWIFHPISFFEQCQVVVFAADDLGFLGPGSPDLVTELCPPQGTAWMLREVIEKKA